MELRSHPPFSHHLTTPDAESVNHVSGPVIGPRCREKAALALFALALGCSYSVGVFSRAYVGGLTPRRLGPRPNTGTADDSADEWRASARLR